ncbi:UBR4-like protein [Mya arenaria]|uniref:UBR4-like protein n=1 Tax=Mya arenaria TaxID=6604 RepID=A0ABY7GB09_MYAAR|nr:UBR4-like protein [Mya arenaria]
MVDGVGVCTVCAKVCHKDHDLTYAKFGSFFCDCGAKEERSCKALVKRTSQSGLNSSEQGPSQSPFVMETTLPSSLRRRLSSPLHSDKQKSSESKEEISEGRRQLAQKLESSRDELMRILTVQNVSEMLDCIMPMPTESYRSMSPMGNLGDQGQQIRQLITSHMLRRVAMCVLASPQGKRQHLAVSHEKGKITILQLSALLKQADSSKKKLTLTRLASAPIPFTVLSITGNPCNEDYLAVCGLKDCHVLTFTSSGSVADHLVLHPQLASGNYIIKALWLPGTQTELAIVTSDFVKIYNLSSDALSPQYYFLLPSGKIRDATFVFTEEGRYFALMSSVGYIYYEVMGENSSAKHGPFYITNVVEVTHPDIKDVNGHVTGGGVSIYFSHALQLLFFSYAQGKCFCAPLEKDLSSTPRVFPITFKSSNGGGKGNSSQQPLVQWSEVPGHTGLIYCMTQTTNNPVVLMVKPDTLMVQEIKVVPAKAKIQDVVAIRHNASNSDQQRTTMILLCEDGSLRIYMANVDNTNYWLSPFLQPQSPISVLKPVKKKKTTKSGRQAGSVNFPIDYFENCQQSTDIEFGGNDVLQIYNVQQIKHRLNTTGLYIASTKTEHHWTVHRKHQVGPSTDAGGVTMMDSIKIFTKTKEVFGWPEEPEDFADQSSAKPVPSAVAAANESETTLATMATLPLTSADRLLSSALEVLEGAFSAMSAEEKDSLSERALTTATSLLTLPTPSSVQQHTKALLAALFQNKTVYYAHKDETELGHVIKSLHESQSTGCSLDVEAFQRLLVTARSVAVSRPGNLVKFAEGASTQEGTKVTQSQEKEDLENEDSQISMPFGNLESGERCHFTAQLMECFCRLLAARPPNPMLAPVCLPGLAHVDATVAALVESIHAFTVIDLDNLTLASKLYAHLLLNSEGSVSFACKQAMIRVLRPRTKRKRVFIPSPPRCSSPGGEESETRGVKPEVTMIQSISINEAPDEEEDMDIEIVESNDPMVLEPSDADEGHPLEALLQRGANFNPVVDIPPDADDETMVELAIALSLQEQNGGGIGLQGLRLASQQQNVVSYEDSQMSDTTASAPGSDDEIGSNAATDGSTLRTSPADHGGSAGSESGGSAEESISGEHNASARSSVYGDRDRGPRSETSSLGGPSSAMPQDPVLLMLTSDLDSEDEKDCAALDGLLSSLLHQLDFSGSKLDTVMARSKSFEVKLVCLRLLSVLLSRTKAGTKQSNESTSFISNTTASALLSNGAVGYCLKILQNLLPYWRNYNPAEEETAPLPGQLLRPRSSAPPPDMSPFFLRQYVKGHANDVFEDYPQLLTEMALRLPYQLLLFICGSKEKYRELRDLHSIETNLKSVTEQCEKNGLSVTKDTLPNVMLPYDALLVLIEHLKVCADIASSRPVNWQRYCCQNEGIILFLMKASTSLDEGVAPTLLQLLQCALCGSAVIKASVPQELTDPRLTKATSGKQSKDADTDKTDGTEQPAQDGNLCAQLIAQLNRQTNTELMTNFVRTFLLESNSTSIRWQAHSLVHQIYRNSGPEEQSAMLDLLWTLWGELPQHGRKASQFIDLLGYFLLTKEYLDRAVDLLREQNVKLVNHPNSQIYNMLQGLVDFDGYYLESDPCLVCNNPEVSYSSLKLTNIKVDSKFTTTTQIVKLVGSYTISKISLRITELKRTKMVRVMNIYYNNRTVQAVVELKNKPGLWHKARKMTLTAGQTDVKVEFPIPIVACNLMIEYADFYDNLQATSETLQCPRCSASVPANPGVCGNCGENVFQCHKCRAINYDEKDPFLCNACGFCKYAKFDFTLTAKPCCAVDPIETEDDRKKAITTINTLLEKADRIYKQLQQHRPALENLLVQVAEHGTERRDDSTGHAPPTQGPAVNKAIQQLALKYCTESKNSFDELSKIIQKVLACRRELVDYDRQQRQAVASAGSPVASPRDPPVFKPVARKDQPSGKGGNCFGCASAAVEHCITLLHALVTNTNLRQILCSQGMIQELIDYNLRRGALYVRSEVRALLCLLTKDNRRGTEEMNNIIMTRIAATGSSVRHEILLLSNSLKQEDSCWESRVRCVMRLFLLGMQMKQPVIMESVTLPCLRILQHLITPEKLQQNKAGGTAEGEPTPVLPMSPDLHVNSSEWIKGNPKFAYANWKKCVPVQTAIQGGLTADSKPEGKNDTEEKADQEPTQPKERAAQRATFLMEKYATRWRQRMWKIPGVPLKLTQISWLQQAVFSPSSQSARQTATRVIEYMAQVPTRKREIIDMLSGCLEQVGKAGECAQEFLALYSRLIQPIHWKHYLAIKGVLLKLGDLITKEVEKLQYLEDTTLSSDLAQGFALKSLTDPSSGRLVGYVLNGYLSLKKLLVQRTKLIDETQDKLLELLEELTSGTESETREFMQVCVDTVQKYPLDDQEENDVGDFFMILEKDPQQEDFLQGRMLGNPYSSSEAGLGPLMRDVKNKICQDCELVALLEDDTGMELLVNKKIISLDLPVKDVYKKIWAPEHGEGEPMQVIYRMRGLLGDATEDMVNSLESNTEEDVDKEEVYRMAGVLATGGGLKVMLDRLGSIKDLVLGKPMMLVLLKLFSFAVNVKANSQELIRPELNTITVMLGALNLALWAEQESGTQATKGQTITEQILQIMETILMEASSQSTETYTEFSKLCGDKAQLMLLLERINSPFVRSNTSVLQALMRLIPFLAFGEEDKMLTLINHFKPYLDFSKHVVTIYCRFDAEHTQDEKVHLDCFCTIAAAIQNNANGVQLKDMIVEQGLVQMALDYILRQAPEIKTLLATDSENWKDFLSKQSLNYILRFLTGICDGHENTQLLLGNHLVPILHKLEQVSSDKHIGTMAENFMETLKKHPVVADKTNAKGQVTVKSSALKQIEDIKEETGLTCCICREGYRYQPQKVLAIYTFTKRAAIDEYENKPRNSIGYSTVSHFNVIHVDCHTAAVRHARGREEWESAALQNANTKCNGLLPLWGPQVQESAFATCLARHNTYLQECTGVRDPGYPFNVHDVKLLLMKFAEGKSFSDDSGGGGRQSNMHLLPYMMHMSLYVINT